MVHHHADQVEAMARHEEAIAALYKAYADKFPDDQDFWMGLSDEELHHAQWLRKLRDLIMKGMAKLNEGRFKVEPIERSIKYIEGYTRQAKNEEMTMLSALSVASDIEHALLEKKFLEIYTSDDERVAKTIETLQAATNAHRIMIDEYLDRMRQYGDTAVG